MELREAYEGAARRFVPFFLTALLMGLRMAPLLLLILIPVAGDLLGLAAVVYMAVRYCLTPLVVLVEEERYRPAILRSVELMSFDYKRSLALMGAGIVVSGAGYLTVSVPVNLLLGLAEAAAGGPLGAVAGEVIGLGADMLAGFVLAWFLAYNYLVFLDLASAKPAAI